MTSSAAASLGLLVFWFWPAGRTLIAREVPVNNLDWKRGMGNCFPKIHGFCLCHRNFETLCVSKVVRICTQTLVIHVNML